jgi:hypothetical protein
MMPYGNRFRKRFQAPILASPKKGRRARRASGAVLSVLRSGSRDRPSFRSGGETQGGRRRDAAVISRSGSRSGCRAALETSRTDGPSERASEVGARSRRRRRRHGRCHRRRCRARRCRPWRTERLNRGHAGPGPGRARPSTSATSAGGEQIRRGRRPPDHRSVDSRRLVAGSDTPPPGTYTPGATPPPGATPTRRARHAPTRRARHPVRQRGGEAHAAQPGGRPCQLSWHNSTIRTGEFGYRQ